MRTERGAPVSKLGLLKITTNYRTVGALANGCEYSSSVHFSIIGFARKSDVIDVIECQDPLATANGSVLCDPGGRDLFIVFFLSPEF